MGKSTNLCGSFTDPLDAFHVMDKGKMEPGPERVLA
jgi:hypothetical protein